ncbi:MAG: hypothetical protein H7644_07785 [Candidatus Heimdallarchaeota archaeon]|nr:hypothetical protein [Candidatus Heimdallarchaeota archaeon]MCK5143652.1 hypothetical protein [Candidatus Heimdallarchaeota archaeon]
MKNKVKIIGLSMMVLMMLTLTQASAGNQVLGYQEQNKLVTLTYDTITIKVNAGGMVPKFQYTEENSGFDFNIMMRSVIEYLDFNEDGAFQYNETGIWMDDPNPPEPAHSNVLALSSIRWTFGGFDVDYVEGTEEVSAVHFNFTSEMVMDPFYSDFEMEIVAHMYLVDTTTFGYIVIGKSELKFDIVMRNWNWQRNDTNLALRFDIAPIKNTYQLSDTNDVACDLGANSSGFENKVENTDSIKQQYKIAGEGVEGWFAYANQAQYRVASTYEYGSVNASHSALGDGTLQTYLSFEHFDDEVVYDPSISVGEDILKTGSLELIFIGSGALMILGLVLLRRRN